MGKTSKKPFVFWQVSTKHFCLICNKALKLNLLAKIPDAKYCYKHNLRQVAIKRDIKKMKREGIPIYNGGITNE